MKINKKRFKKIVVPTLLLVSGVTSSVILATKNDIQNNLIRSNLNSSSLTKDSSSTTLSEATISNDFKTYNLTTSKTNENTKLNFNTQMTYVQFGNFISNNLNNVTTEIPTLTFNKSEGLNAKEILRSAVADGMKSVWSSSNWTTNQPSGVNTPVLWKNHNNTANPSKMEGVRMFANMPEAKTKAIAYGGAPAIKFTTTNLKMGDGTRIFKSFDGFDTTPYRPLSVEQGRWHQGSGYHNSWYEKYLKVVGGAVQGNSLFGESLINNSSRVVNFFSTKNKATNEVSSSNYVTGANNNWINGKGVTYPFQQGSNTTGWYENTSMTTQTLPSWSTDYVDLYLDQIQTTDTTTKFGKQASLQTITYNLGKTQAKVLDANNISAYFRMYVNTNQEQTRSSKVVEGLNISSWYSQNLIDSAHSNRVMSGDTTFLGDTNVEDTLQNINYDLSKLITLDTTATNNYYTSTQGDVWTKSAPQVKFTYNLKLFSALKEAKQIADLVKIIENNTNINENNRNIIKNQIYPALMSGNCDLATLQNFYNSINSNAYGATFNPLKTQASYWTTINDNDWTLPTTTNSNDYVKTILSWADAYSVILPKIFSNDIYAIVTATGSSEQQKVKIYSATNGTWNTINAINNNQQSKTFNNNVTMSFGNFWMTKPDSTEQISNVKGLNVANIYENTGSISNQKKVNLNKATAINTLDVSFAYNPSLAGLIHSPSAGYVLASSNLYALYNTNYYTSDLYKNLLSYRDKFAEDTANQLQLPQSLINDLKQGITFNMTSSFVIPTFRSIDANIWDGKDMNGNVTGCDPSDLKTFVTLSDKYQTALSTANRDDSEANLIALEQARKELDNLGYYYLTVYSSIPVQYYATSKSYADLKKDKTFVEIGEDNGYYGYYIQYSSDKKPLNINDLSKYVTINKTNSTNSTNSEINELAIANEVKSKLSTITSNIELTNKQLDNLINSNQSIDKEIINLNKQINQLLDDMINNNPELAEASKLIDSKYQTQINNTINEIEKKKEDFNKNNKYQGSGFVQNIHKELNYKPELSSLVSTYENKLNDLNVLFTNSEPVLKVQKQIQTLTSSTINKVNELSSQFKNLNDNLTSLNAENATLLAELNKIQKLTYTTTTTKETDINLTWNLLSLATNSKNNDLNSFYNVLSENKLSDYFYVTKDQFATELNNLIKSKTNIDPKLSKTNILYNSNGINEGNNTYSYTFDKNGDKLTSLVQNIEIKEVTQTTHEVNVNNPKIKESDVNFYNNALSIANSNDATALLAEIMNYKKILQTNQTTLANNITKLSNNLESLNNQANNINKYNNSASLYPDYIETEKALLNAKNELTNYEPTIFNGSKLNATLIAVVASVIGLLLIVIIGLIIFIKSKHQAKSKDPNKTDVGAIEEYAEQLNLSKKKEKKF